MDNFLWNYDWKMHCVTHTVVMPEDVTPQGTSKGTFVYSMEIQLCEIMRYDSA